MLRQIRTVGSAVERFVDIEEVTGSIPVRSTTRLIGSKMQAKIRFATPADFDAILSLDKEATDSTLDRSQQIAEAIAESRCQVMAAGPDIQGFAIKSSKAFRGMDFLDLLVVGSPYRRRGIATSLITHFSEMSDTDESWTSSNQSNQPMISLLTKLHWCQSDHSEELDQGDPEWFFFIK